MQIEIFTRYAAKAVSSCFLDTELQEEAFQALKRFFSVLEAVVICSNFVPFRLLHFFVQRPLSRLRRSITKNIEDTIRQHQDEPTLQNSSFIRAAVDKLDDDLTRERFTTEQIGDHVILLLFAGSINTSTLIQHVIIDLANNPSVYEELRSEVSECIARDDMDGIQKSVLLNACLMESSRLNANLIGFTRKCRENITLGNYEVGKGDVVSVCTPMMMEDASIFKEPLNYNPHRFIGENSEQFTSTKVLNWGAGTHLCPGKQFSIFEIKILIAYLVDSFRFEIPTEETHVKHITFSSFAKRKVDVKLLMA